MHDRLAATSDAAFFPHQFPFWTHLSAEGVANGLILYDVSHPNVGEGKEEEMEILRIFGLHARSTPVKKREPIYAQQCAREASLMLLVACT